MSSKLKTLSAKLKKKLTLRVKQPSTTIWHLNRSDEIEDDEIVIPVPVLPPKLHNHVYVNFNRVLPGIPTSSDNQPSTSADTHIYEPIDSSKPARIEERLYDSGSESDDIYSESNIEQSSHNQEPDYDYQPMLSPRIIDSSKPARIEERLYDCGSESDDIYSESNLEQSSHNQEPDDDYQPMLSPRIIEGELVFQEEIYEEDPYHEGPHRIDEDPDYHNPYTLLPVDDSLYQSYNNSPFNFDKETLGWGQQLIHAVRKADIIETRTILREVVPEKRQQCLEVSVEKGKCALYFAIKHEAHVALELLEMLLQGIAIVNMLKLLTRLNRSGQKSPFLLAVALNRLQIIGYLLPKVSAEYHFRLVTHCDKTGRNSFHMITSSKSYWLARQLFSAVPRDKWCKILMHKTIDEENVSPIHMIVKKGNIKLLEYLRANIPAHQWNDMLEQPVNDGGCTILHIAVYKTSSDKAIEYLIEKIPRSRVYKLLQKRDKAAHSVMSLTFLNLKLGAYKVFKSALEERFWESLTEEMESSYENVDVLDNRDLMSLADTLITCQDSGAFAESLESFKEMEQSRIFTVLGIQSINGETVLHRAADIGCFDLFSFLPQLIVSEEPTLYENLPGNEQLYSDDMIICMHAKLLRVINIKNHDEETVLHYACRQDNLEILKKLCSLLTEDELLTLLRHKSKSNDPLRNGTCLHTAVCNENVDAVKWILQQITSLPDHTCRDLFDATNEDGLTIWQLDISRRMRLVLDSNFDSYYATRPSYKKSVKRVLVFYNVFEEYPDMIRVGAETEAYYVYESFKSLGFSGAITRGWSEQEILESIEQDIEEFKERCCMLVVLIMTHGQKGLIMAKGPNRLIKIDDVLRKMQELDRLTPKVLLVQACQGSKYPLGLRMEQDYVDVRPPLDARLPEVGINIADMNTAVVMATLNNHSAQRNFFMKYLSEELNSAREVEKNFHDIFQKICDRMSKVPASELETGASPNQIAQIPRLESTLRKKLMLSGYLVEEEEYDDVVPGLEYINVEIPVNEIADQNALDNNDYEPVGPI